MEEVPPELDDTLDASEKPDISVGGQPSDVDFGERFVVLERVGVGGMGAVYRVIDRELDEVVALKSMLPKLNENRSAVTRFRREVKLARRITHENVARIHDLHTRDTDIFLTMEFIDGEPLNERIARTGRLDVEAALSISRDICAALAAAHDAGVVHRDLKPANVLLTNDGRAIVTDFGIATVSGSSDDSIVGTPHYIAPEQARGLAVDGRSDLYSFGVMLYEMLTGVRPFDGQTTSEVIMKRFLVAPPVLPEDVASHRERRLIERLLAVDPGRRPPDARATLREISDTKSVIPTADLPRARTNIALGTNAFVGREEELRELRERIQSEGQRLVTILGAGGTGKTRLAEEFGRQVTGDLPGGVWFVNVRSTASVDDLWSAIATAMGLEGADSRELVKTQIGKTPALLILDEAEPAARQVSALITELLGTLDPLKIVVTSRLRLRHPAEFVFELHPLIDQDARRLFTSRARQYNPSFEVMEGDRETIDAIVERVDRIPLAIELAAGRLGALPLPKLLERLGEQLRTLRSRGDANDRHSTLRATISGSVQMLSPGARRALANLSVFAGGGPIEAANSVLERLAGEYDLWPEDLVEELWDHSLIRVDSAGVHDRFSMLSAIAEFASEELQTTSSEAQERASRLHAEYFAEFATARVGSATLRVTGQVEREVKNLETAIDTAIRLSAPELAISTLLVFWDACERRGAFARVIELADRCLTLDDRDLRAAAFWARASALWRMGESREALDKIARGLETVDDSRIHGRLLLTRGNLHWAQGDHDRALRDYIDAEQHSADADRDTEATAHGNRGLVHWNRGDFELATLRFREALDMHRASEATARIGPILSNMANIETERGNLDQAIELMEQALEADRLAGDRRSEAIVLNNLGNVWRLKGNVSRARDHLERSLQLNREHGNRRMVAICLSNLGVTYGETDRARAIDLCEQALQLSRETNLRRFEGIALTSLATFDRREKRLDSAAERLREAEDILREIDAPAELARLLCEASHLAVSQDNLEAARQHFDEASAIADALAVGPDSELGQMLGELRINVRDDG